MEEPSRDACCPVDDSAIVKRWQSLADQGLLVSVCHGPRTVEQGRIIWTVTVMHAESEIELVNPIEGRDLAHCIEIAEMQAPRLLRAAVTLKAAEVKRDDNA